MMRTYEIYPKDLDSSNDFPAYYVEYHRWKESEPLRWQLFKRQFFMTREKFDELKKDDSKKDDLMIFIGREGHPWNLGEGIVNEYPGVISMHTKKFLEYMVDALNEKVYRELNEKTSG